MESDDEEEENEGGANNVNRSLKEQLLSINHIFLPSKSAEYTQGVLEGMEDVEEKSSELFEFSTNNHVADVSCQSQVSVFSAALFKVSYYAYVKPFACA